MIEIPANKQVILFDGICNFCNSTVNYIIRVDQKKKFVFCPIESETGKQIIEHIGISKQIDSIILYHPSVSYHIESDAILNIAQKIGGIHKLLLFFWIIPKPLRNLAYRYFAKNRYRLFGKKQSCMIPTPELKERFI